CSSGSNEDPAKTGVGLPDIVVSVYAATFGECNCLPEEPLRALIFLAAVGIQSQVQPGFRWRRIQSRRLPQIVIRLLRLVRTERHIAQEKVRKKISRVDSQLLEKLPAGLRREHPFVPHQVRQAEKVVAVWNFGIE